jgi:DNA invertase Pin-like site-specific DNA recombinase
MSDKILPTHRDRRAVVYLRQSSLKQVHEHRESTARQYALRERAVEQGWPADRIDVIDEDLGQSGSATEWRTGFQRLAEDVAQGRTGAIFALEVSRLARSSADWHRLLELCGLADVVIADEQAVYTPRDFNDRLLLGLKGTMSEAEQYWMRLRLDGGRLSKARRGALAFVPPAGYEWDAATARFRFDPDEQVQRAVRLVFERFRLDGSAYGVTRYLTRHGLPLPARNILRRELRWGPARQTLILSMLHNPIYAGAYVFGRHEDRMCLVNGQRRRRRHTRLPQGAWRTCLQDQHPGYITWDEFMANQRKLADNRTTPTAPDRRGAAREGAGLLQGLALCGRCGHRMGTRYPGPRGRAVYMCLPRVGYGVCWSVSAPAIDRAVSQLFLDAIQPPQVELSLAVLRETERQAGEVERQWTLRLERARYEAQLAERRYKAIDPDYRVVARTLEREWNDTLVALEHLEREYQDVRRREAVDLTEDDRARILALARDLPAVWAADTTTHAERKTLLRLVVREVTLSPIAVPTRSTRVQVLWHTGAVSDLTVPRKDKYTAQATPAHVLSLIRDLYLNRKKGDGEIAAQLNRRGLRTGLNHVWDVGAVRRARYSESIYRPSPKARRPRDRRSDGLYSVHAVAARAGVKPSAIRYWVRTGALEPVERHGPGHPHWFKLDPATIDRLQTLAAEYARRRGAGSENPQRSSGTHDASRCERGERRPNRRASGPGAPPVDALDDPATDGTVGTEGGVVCGYLPATRDQPGALSRGPGPACRLAPQGSHLWVCYPRPASSIGRPGRHPVP